MSDVIVARLVEVLSSARRKRNLSLAQVSERTVAEHLDRERVPGLKRSLHASPSPPLTELSLREMYVMWASTSFDDKVAPWTWAFQQRQAADFAAALVRADVKTNTLNASLSSTPVAVSMLHKIEAGTSVPSRAVMWRLLMALEIDGHNSKRLMAWSQLGTLDLERAVQAASVLSQSAEAHVPTSAPRADAEQTPPLARLASEVSRKQTPLSRYFAVQRADESDVHRRRVRISDLYRTLLRTPAEVSQATASEDRSMDRVATDLLRSSLPDGTAPADVRQAKLSQTELDALLPEAPDGAVVHVLYAPMSVSAVTLASDNSAWLVVGSDGAEKPVWLRRFGKRGDWVGTSPLRREVVRFLAEPQPARSPPLPWIKGRALALIMTLPPAPATPPER